MRGLWGGRFSLFYSTHEVTWLGPAHRDSGIVSFNPSPSSSPSLLLYPFSLQLQASHGLLCPLLTPSTVHLCFHCFQFQVCRAGTCLGGPLPVHASPHWDPREGMERDLHQSATFHMKQVGVVETGATARAQPCSHGLEGPLRGSEPSGRWNL